MESCSKARSEEKHRDELYRTYESASLISYFHRRVIPDTSSNISQTDDDGLSQSL